MSARTVILAPLETEERLLLKEIYHKRLISFLAGLFIPVLVTVFLYPFIAVMACAAAVVVYLRRIHPFYRDFRGGLKKVHFYQVTMKQFFPHTGQYFIGTGDPKYLHHEVDADTYALLSVGQLFAIYVAPHSKYAFNMRNRYTLL